jgi:hypothetical protein
MEKYIYVCPNCKNIKALSYKRIAVIKEELSKSPITCTRCNISIEKYIEFKQMGRIQESKRTIVPRYNIEISRGIIETD